MSRASYPRVLLVLAVLGACGAPGAADDDPLPPGATPSEKPAAVETKPVPPPALAAPPDEPAGSGESIQDYLYDTSQAIEMFEGRVRRNPQDYISYRILGELLYRRAEEGGGIADFARAEEALRKSLAIQPDYIVAKTALAGALCQRHQFARALELASEVRKARPRNHEALAITADALIEMGRIAEGREALGELARLVRTAPVLARLANLAELEGRVAEAEELVREAIAKIQKAGGTDKELAWYRCRLGDFAVIAGRLDEAEGIYEAVPAGTDPFHDATAGRGRIAAYRGKLAEAIDLYEKAVAIGPDPHMLAELGDLYLATDRRDQAEAAFARLMRETEGHAEYLRERARFLADHDRDLPEALRLAREDFAGRQDVHGHDVLAWALFKNGRLEEAAEHAAAATALGTRDPVLYFHAGLIHDRLGDRAQARQELQKALEIRPNFSVLHTEEARRRLEELERESRQCSLRDDVVQCPWRLARMAHRSEMDEGRKRAGSFNFAGM